MDRIIRASKFFRLRQNFGNELGNRKWQTALAKLAIAFAALFLVTVNTEAKPVGKSAAAAIASRVLNKEVVDATPI